MGKKNSQIPKAPKLSIFPKIYRFITESWKIILTSFVSGLILIGIAIQSISLYKNIQEEQKLDRERGQIEKELAYWKKLSSEYKDYRDVHFKIATLEYRLGNTPGAKESLDRVLEIDPNFEKARTMERQLEL